MAIQNKMFADQQKQELFAKAQQYGLDYISKARDRNVFPTEEALTALKQFDGDLPECGDTASAILDLLQEFGTPATISQVAGRYFGFVNGSVVPAALAAKNLSIFWDQNSCLSVMSPICGKLEAVVEKWLITLLGLPEQSVAGFVSGTSMANFCGLAAARYRLLAKQGWDINEQGLFGAPKLRVVTGSHTHSSILKAIALAGFGRGNIEFVDCDDQGRVLADKMPTLDDSTLLILQAGNVNSGAFDPFEKICKTAKEQGTWIHIDGAFGLWAGATKTFGHLTEGYAHADSWAVDGHKTLNTPYDSGIILCADREALASSLHISAPYLSTSNEREGMYYTPEMSRRARIIELWATLKYLGREGIDEMISNMHQRAVQFASLLEKVEGFEVLNDVVFNQVIAQCKSDTLTESVMQEVQKQRVCWVGGSSWKGRKVIRISVCSWATTAEDIELSYQSFVSALRKCLSEETSYTK